MWKIKALLISTSALDPSDAFGVAGSEPLCLVRQGRQKCYQTLPVVLCPQRLFPPLCSVGQADPDRRSGSGMRGPVPKCGNSQSCALVSWEQEQRGGDRAEFPWQQAHKGECLRLAFQPCLLLQPPPPSSLQL